MNTQRRIDPRDSANQETELAASRKIRRMPCPERARLLDLYSDATHNLLDLVIELRDVAISYEVDAFDRAWEHCESARRHCADVRQQIYAHAAEHQCALSLTFGRVK